MAKSATSCREPIHACLQIVGRGEVAEDRNFHPTAFGTIVPQVVGPSTGGRAGPSHPIATESDALTDLSSLLLQRSLDVVSTELELPLEGVSEREGTGAPRHQMPHA